MLVWFWALKAQNNKVKAIIYIVLFITTYIGCMYSININYIPIGGVIPTLAMLTWLKLKNLQQLQWQKAIIDSKINQMIYLGSFLVLFWIVPMVAFNTPSNIKAITNIVITVLAILGIQTVCLWILQEYVTTYTFTCIIVLLIFYNFYDKSISSTQVVLYAFIILMYIVHLYVSKYNDKYKIILTDCLRDAKTIEYHFNKEFLLISVIRKIYLLNLIVIISFIQSNGWEIAKEILENPMEATIKSDAIMVVFILGIILNVFFLYTRTIIIDDCNLKINAKLFHKCLNCVMAGGTSGLFALGIHLTPYRKVSLPA